ncbi:glycosyltransferase [Streptomyces sp. NBC_01314]|uniref:glycosyltransferase n=1 Tax=Streptomyces sp. NBC_01314 TaxID=2903821 RepID=UPI00352E61B5
MHRDRITFHGLATDQEVLTPTSAATPSWCPNTAELQSLVTLEAMAAGKPVVAADATALPHMVHPGRDSYLFRPGVVGALADRLMGRSATRRPGAGWARPAQQIVADPDMHRTLAAFEALCLHAAVSPRGHGDPPRPSSLPSSHPAMESEHDEYAARSGRR